MATKRFKMALIQMCCEQHRAGNLVKAEKMIKEAAKQGAKIVALPEYFTCWMDPKYFIENKESLHGPTTQMLSRSAKENNIYLLGGTFPEAIEGSEMLYNTSPIFNPSGKLEALFRKIHLFDVDLGPRLKIRESELNIPGNKLTTLETEYCRIGFGVCLDLRYPEVARLYAERGCFLSMSKAGVLTAFTFKGCKLLTYMGGFSTKTGPAHLEILQRVRAVDNQVFVANVGPATDERAPYVTYGHSGVADPWGNMVAKTGSDEDIVYADIDLDYIDEVRRQMPLEDIRRNDIYKTIDMTSESSI